MAEVRRGEFAKSAITCMFTSFLRPPSSPTTTALHVPGRAGAPVSLKLSTYTHYTAASGALANQYERGRSLDERHVTTRPTSRAGACARRMRRPGLIKRLGWAYSGGPEGQDGAIKHEVRARTARRMRKGRSLARPVRRRAAPLGVAPRSSPITQFAHARRCARQPYHARQHDHAAPLDHARPRQSPSRSSTRRRVRTDCRSRLRA